MKILLAQTRLKTADFDFNFNSIVDKVKDGFDLIIFPSSDIEDLGGKDLVLDKDCRSAQTNFYYRLADKKFNSALLIGNVLVRNGNVEVSDDGYYDICGKKVFVSDSFIEDVNYEIQKENDELKALLNIKETLSEYDVIYATVVERNNFYWLNTLVINKGSMDGVEEGLAVVDNSGLIGAISDVSNATSTVKLITLDDKYNSISVKVKGNDYELNKILKVKDGNLIIEGINKNINIQIGDKIVTNGLSNKFPSGITIGEVSMVNEDLYSISNIATVSLSANINNLRFVAILKRKI